MTRTATLRLAAVTASGRVLLRKGEEAIAYGLSNSVR